MGTRFSTVKKRVTNPESGGIKMKPVEMGYNQKCQVKSGFYIFFN